MKTDNWPDRRSSWGDAAVDGLLAGAAAGVIMAAYLVAIGLLGGQTLQAVLAQFDPGPQPRPLPGALAHLAVAAIYGALFGIAVRRLRLTWQRLPIWPLALGYGLILWLVAQGLVDSQASSAWLASSPPIHLAIAHLAYGVVLGVAIRRLPS